MTVTFYEGKPVRMCGQQRSKEQHNAQVPKPVEAVLSHRFQVGEKKTGKVGTLRLGLHDPERSRKQTFVGTTTSLTLGGQRLASEFRFLERGRLIGGSAGQEASLTKLMPDGRRESHHGSRHQGWGA